MRDSIRQRILRDAALAFMLIAAGCGDTAEPAAYEELDRLRIVGLAHLEEEQIAEAAEQFRRLAILAPNEPLGPANLALAELRRGNAEGGRRFGEQAVERMPTDPDVRLIAAVVSAEAGDRAAAEEQLRAALAQDSGHVRALWALHRLTEESDLLDRLLRLSPGNLPARLTAAEARAQSGDVEAALGHLEYIGQLLSPGLSEARTELTEGVIAASRGDAEQTLRHVRILHNLLRADHLYSTGLSDLTGSPGAQAEPLHRFRRLDSPARPGPTGPLSVSFVRTVALDRGWTGGVVTDVDGDGDEDLVVSDGEWVACLMNENGKLTEWDCVARATAARVPVQAADFDGDARADLLMAGPGGVGILYADEDGFAPRGELPDHETAAYTAVAADFDHDGDLDILVGGPGPTRLYRQAGEGQFVDVGAASGFGTLDGVWAATVGDLDVDGDLDVVVAVRDGIRRMDNVRQGIFQPIGGALTPKGIPMIADVTGDGWLDLVVGAPDGIFVGQADGSGELGALTAAAVLPAPEGQEAGRSVPLRMIVEDFDLDGRLDVLLAWEQAGIRAFRGSGNGGYVASPDAIQRGHSSPAGHMLVFDSDGDGDFDLVGGSATEPVLFRNQGGERNHVLEVSLLALADGSGKVNRLGIGSRIDVWAGNLRQSRVVGREVERFGLGDRTRADVVRIEWTNGVPQNVFEPRTAERLVERQVLKGSCAFLYAWTGDGFEFVTDMMWKSALGMPLGIMAAGEITYASPDPSLEYVRIPPDMLTPRDGVYEIRVTEELWEVAYLDRLELLAVDHPEDAELYVDEAFGAPTVPNRRLFAVWEKRSPELAVDHRGNDARVELAERDFRFVGGFDPGPYQGLTRSHDLTLTLEGAAGRPARLFLAGWVHPTDASINMRIGQAGGPPVVRPYVEVPDEGGGWRRLDGAIDFPSGKNKTVVVELPNGLPLDDPRLRVRTNMEIYWDVAFYSTELSGIDLVPHRLAPVEAELRVRGFSRMFRRGGRYGPHWFDYGQVQSASPWRTLRGAYTRTGDVLELLVTGDDRYVVFGPGDEIAVRFAASPGPPEGRERTFFLYSDGFLKDADLNTRGGDRVAPLPRHGQRTYPPLSSEAPALAEFANEYLTRYAGDPQPPARPQYAP
ncbi:MAG TPA: FG-GAP-like repeat-containing protein [Gemmatimonadota bacterium]|nr:FG-GAP-like repeat-containing protein [Gemmatimonadota bacterium]